MKKFVSEQQRLLFAEVALAGDLIFACGPRGISANIVGSFSVRTNHHGDDQLDMGDGSQHVHVDWSRIKRLELTESRGEGVLNFFDGDELMFKLYRINGFYSSAVSGFAGALV
jgi:hypothetical protein